MLHVTQENYNLGPLYTTIWIVGWMGARIFFLNV
jgi:hypothetical protein